MTKGVPAVRRGTPDAERRALLRGAAVIEDAMAAVRANPPKPREPRLPVAATEATPPPSGPYNPWPRYQRMGRLWYETHDRYGKAI